MKMLQQTTPEKRAIGLDEVILQIRQAERASDGPVMADAVKFCAALSGLLLNDKRAQDFAGLQALGFWLRPAAVDAMIKQYLTDEDTICRVPRGTIFVIPPANTENLFGYIAAMCLLCGNVTVIRLPSALEPAQELLAVMIGEALLAFPTLHRRVFLLRYAHDAAVTAALSALCDARLVWGGDDTVRTIRAIALPPLAREVSFSDRFSSCALNAAGYMALDASGRDKLAQAFFNDMFVFDQLACASPRLLVWVGPENGAGADFYGRLAAIAAAKNYQPGAAESIAKRSACYLAMHDLDAAAFQVFSPALAVLTLRSLEKFAVFKSVNYGYGLLIVARLASLSDLARSAERRDQTLALWGFDREAIQAFVADCRGRGFDRIVPVGQALAFDPVWDGFNLFDVMTRLVRVDA